MPENTGGASAGSPGGAADTTAQAATASSTPAEQTPPNESPTNTAISPDEFRKVQAEAKSLRARLKAFEEKDAAAQQAAMSDLEKAQTTLTKAQAEVEQYRRLYADTLVRLEAKELGFANAQLAAKLVGDGLEFGEDGVPSNARALLEALLKSDPYLKATPADEASAANPPTRAALGATNPGRGQTAATIADFRAGRMSQADAKRMWDNGDMTRLLEAEANKQRR